MNSDMHCQRCSREMVQVGEPYKTWEDSFGSLIQTDYACPWCCEINLAHWCSPEFRHIEYEASIW